MPKPRVAFSPAVARRILEGLRAGHGLRRLTRQPGMPTRATVMRWLKHDPHLLAAALNAREPAGLNRPGRPTGYSRALHLQIFDRLAAGEPLRTLCRDPAMPSRATVHAWARRHPGFARDLDVARACALQAQADRRLASLGFRDLDAFLAAPPKAGPPERQP